MRILFALLFLSTAASAETQSEMAAEIRLTMACALWNADRLAVQNIQKKHDELIGSLDQNGNRLARTVSDNITVLRDATANSISVSDEAFAALCANSRG